MAWYWNEYVYIGIWILMLFFGLGAAVYAMVTGNEEGFVDPSFDLPSFLAPYKIKEVCEVFQPVLEAEINAERADGTSQRSDAEARERAMKNLQSKIPGGSLQCPIQFNTSEDLREQRDQFQKLPETFLVTIYATLVYSVVNLQMTYNKIVKTMQEANKAKQEAFEDICTPEQATEKRKTQCKLPEEVTPEEKANLEERYKAEITKKKTTMIQALNAYIANSKSDVSSKKQTAQKEFQAAFFGRQTLRKKVKDKGENASSEDQKALEEVEERVAILEETISQLSYTEIFLSRSMDDMIKESKSLIQKIDVLKKKLEAGDTTLPQESFMDYFVSPLH